LTVTVCPLLSPVDGLTVIEGLGAALAGTATASANTTAPAATAVSASGRV